MKPKRRNVRGLYAPELLEGRIAPATFMVTNLNDAGAGSLRQAVTDANFTAATDTILFKTGLTGEITLTTGAIGITASLTITGPGPGKIAIDGSGADRIFTIDDSSGVTVKSASISGLSLLNANAPGTGGAIFSHESLALTNVVVSHNVAADKGGGLYISSTGTGIVNLAVTNCRFTDNLGIQGGGICADVNGGIRIISTIISGNTSSGAGLGAGGGGGGLSAHVQSGGLANILIKDSNIVGNTTFANGGGASLDNDRIGGRVIIRNTTISGNAAPAGGGGGLYLDDGIVLIDTSSISNNEAKLGGGGIDDDFLSSLTIRASKIINNRTTDAMLGGGGIFAQGTHPVLIQDSLISGNFSGHNGGGIYGGTGSAITVQNTTLSGNVATQNGGGIYVGSFTATTNSSLKLIGAKLTDNRAIGNDGGGVSIFGNGTTGSVQLDVTASLFRGNRAANDGGGIQFHSTGLLRISGTRFLDNFAQGSGGGLSQSDDAAVRITDSVFLRNVANGSGGGLYLGGADSKVVTRALIKDNLARSPVLGGGGIYLSGTGILTVKESTVTGNIARIGGGVINGTIVPVVLIGTTISDNIAETFPNRQGLFTHTP